MARMKYGADIRYVTCKRADLKTVPIIDGQLITFLDADGIFYDIEGTRHTVGNFATVNELPLVGVANTLYVMATPEDENSALSYNLYIWSDELESYIDLIPEPTIRDDAPDDENWYFRLKGQWKFDDTVFYINEAWSAEECFSKLQDFINAVKVKSNKLIIVGHLPMLKGITIDAPIHLDMTRCNTSDYNVQETKSYVDDWYSLKIINSRGIEGLYATNAWILLDAEPIELGGSIKVCDCFLKDSRLDVSGSKNDVIIQDNTFKSNDKDVIPVINSESKAEKNNNNLYLVHNTFFSSEPTQFATFLDENRNTILTNNSFRKSIPLFRRKESTFNLSTNINPGVDVIPHSEIYECRKGNFCDLFSLDIEVSTLIDSGMIIKLSAKKSASNLFIIGETFITSGMFLGVADIRDKETLFEVRPKTVTSFDYADQIALPDIASVRHMRVGERIDISGIDRGSTKDILRELSESLNDSTVDSVSSLLDMGSMLSVYTECDWIQPNETYSDEYFKDYPGNTSTQIYQCMELNGTLAVYENIDTGKFGTKIFTDQEISTSDTRYIIEVEREV